MLYPLNRFECLSVQAHEWALVGYPIAGYFAIYSVSVQKLANKNMGISWFRVISAYNKIGPCQNWPITISAHNHFSP